MKMETIKPRSDSFSATHPAAVMSPALALALVVAAAAMLAIAIQSLWIPIDADVSWLITVCERVLAGDRLYVDIVELNPPASVWMYVPFVWAAKLIGAKPEAFVVGGFVAAACASVATTIGFAARLKDSPPRLWLAAVLSFVTLVLPMALFAQREHAALLLALPAIAALADIAERGKIGRLESIASGLAAGLMVIIKPYFLFAVLAPALWAAWRRRSLVPLLPGTVAAAATVAVYGIALLAFASDYFQWVPVIAQTYVPMRAALWKVMVAPALYPAICLGLVILLRPPRISPLAVAWALAAGGFLVAAIVQGKNYPNHWLPQAGLALTAALTLAAQPNVARARRSAVLAGLAVVAACELYYWTIIPDRAVASEIRRVAPPAPKIIALSPQLTTGHPVTRNVGGRWVGSRAGLFMASGAKYVGLDSETTRRAYRDDIRSFTVDVERHSPDVVLVLKPSKSWLMAEPSVARTMRDYRFETSAGDTEIWVRR